MFLSKWKRLTAELWNRWSNKESSWFKRKFSVVSQV